MAHGCSVGMGRALAALFVFGAVACGSPAPPPAAPPPAQPAPVASTAAAPPPPSAAPVASEAPPPPPPAPEAVPAPEAAPTRSQKPIDMLTARDAAFLVDYANSDVKQRATEACNKEKEPDKIGACLEKARDAFQADVIRFKRDQDNKKDWEKKVQLLIYKRYGSTLREVSVGTVQLAEQGDDGVQVMLGKQKGARPLWRGQATAIIKAPNDYSIEVTDPEYGTLRYDAKIGLVTD